MIWMAKRRTIDGEGVASQCLEYVSKISKVRSEEMYGRPEGDGDGERKRGERDVETDER